MGSPLIGANKHHRLRRTRPGNPVRVTTCQSNVNQRTQSTQQRDPKGEDRHTGPGNRSNTQLGRNNTSKNAHVRWTILRSAPPLTRGVPGAAPNGPTVSTANRRPCGTRENKGKQRRKIAVGRSAITRHKESASKDAVAQNRTRERANGQTNRVQTTLGQSSTQRAARNECKQPRAKMRSCTEKVNRSDAHLRGEARSAVFLLLQVVVRGHVLGETVRVRLRVQQHSKRSIKHGPASQVAAALDLRAKPAKRS